MLGELRVSFNLFFMFFSWKKHILLHFSRVLKDFSTLDSWILNFNYFDWKNPVISSRLKENLFLIIVLRIVIFFALQLDTNLPIIFFSFFNYRPFYFYRIMKTKIFSNQIFIRIYNIFLQKYF